jgi:phospholipid/cholesterol/gamma-HCH transport system substrate-binding protein
VEVVFPDATSLADQADVRIAGVTVGKVVKRRRDSQGNAQVATIRLEEQYAPLRSNAKAMLRQKTLLGETYIELTGGTRDARNLPEGGRLPRGNVTDQVDFDELLRTFDQPTRRAFQRWQSTLAEGTGGRAADLNEGFGHLPGFVESGDRLVELLNRRRQVVAQLVRNTGTTFEAITRDGQKLQTLVTTNRQVFDEIAGERESLAEAIRIFPTFQRESRATMRRLSRFAIDTEPLIRDLDPALEDAVPTLASLRRLAPDLRNFFDDLPPLIRAGDTGFPALSRVLRGLDPTLASMGPFLEQLNPILEYLEVQQNQVTDFLSIGQTALNHKLPVEPENKSNGYSLPQLIMLGSQSIPTMQRDPNNRGNTYMEPSGYRYDEWRQGFFTLPNWDCANAGGETKHSGSGPGSKVACKVAPQQRFQGKLEQFPRVDDARRGGATPGRGDVPEQDLGKSP